jgi:protein-tyrosine phosphatase
MAAALLHRVVAPKIAGVTTLSAGLAALVGHGADDIAVGLMAERGIDLRHHRAVQVNPDLLRWSDLVLVMEEAQRTGVHRLAASAVGKTFLLGHWTRTEIPDPYQRGPARFEEVLDLIDQAIAAWAPRLRG